MPVASARRANMARRAKKQNIELILPSLDYPTDLRMGISAADIFAPVFDIDCDLAADSCLVH